MDLQPSECNVGKIESPPMWLRLRVQYGFASEEEKESFEVLRENEEENRSLHLASCAPSGCESSGSTGGCSPGTACLFTCLQSKQK